MREQHTPGKACDVPSINENVEPTIKITRDNLNEALRILRKVLDEEAQSQ